MKQEAPLVFYDKDGQRTVIGTAVVDANGSVEAVVQDERFQVIFAPDKVDYSIAQKIPRVVEVVPIPKLQFPRVKLPENEDQICLGGKMKDVELVVYDRDHNRIVIGNAKVDELTGEVWANIADPDYREMFTPDITDYSIASFRKSDGFGEVIEVTPIPKLRFPRVQLPEDEAHIIRGEN